MSLFGPRVKQILGSASESDIACPGATGSIYTKSFELKHFLSGALIYKATSGGEAVNLLVELEQSDVVPTQEGAADTKYVVPEGISAIDTVVDENKHIKSVSPVPTQYARLKITRQGGNHADVTINVGFSVQEEL